MFFEKKSWALEPKKLYLTNAGAVFSLYAVNLVGKRELNLVMFIVISFVFVMVLFEGKTAAEAVKELMLRDKTIEHSD